MKNKTQMEITEGWYKLRYENQDIIGYIQPNPNPDISRFRNILLIGFNEIYGGKFYEGWVSRDAEELQILEKLEGGVEKITREIRKQVRNLTSMADEILLFAATKVKGVE